MDGGTHVKISLQVRTWEAEEERKRELSYKGIYRTVGGKRHLLYEEILPDDERTVRNHLIISEKNAELRRSGALCGRMLFDPDAPTDADLRNDYGRITFQIRTRRLLRTGTETPCSLEIAYTLLAGEEEISEHELVFVITEER